MKIEGVLPTAFFAAAAGTITLTTAAFRTGTTTTRITGTTTMGFGLFPASILL
jgi:hypothetical protein